MSLTKEDVLLVKELIIGKLSATGTNIILNSKLDITNVQAAIGSANVTISNVAPSAVGTATISAWLQVVNSGVTYYVPMWT